VRDDSLADNLLDRRAHGRGIADQQAGTAVDDRAGVRPAMRRRTPACRTRRPP
jgi:hypothetical protein